MKNFCRSILITFLACLPTLVYAEDIEIYINPQPPLGAEPLVMFTLDYRPSLGSGVANYSAFFLEQLGADDADVLAIGNNWTYFDLLRQSMRVVLQNVSGVQVGLMLNHRSCGGSGCAGPTNVAPNKGSGGYVAMGFRSMQPGDSNGAKAEFARILRSLYVPSGGSSHFHQGEELFFELFRYLTGGEVYSGRNGYLSYPGAPDYKNNLNLDDAAQGLRDVMWDESIMEFSHNVTSGGKTYPIYRYNSPLADATHCTRVFTINFQMNVVNHSDHANAAIAQSRQNGGLGVTAPGSFADMVRYMYDADLGDGTYGDQPEVMGKQNVVSYFVASANLVNHAHIRAQAQAGGTGLPIPAGENPQDLIDTLNNIFEQILSVSTTFVAASVPVNVFNRSEIVDNVYIALFQADPDAKPAWPGSLKKLRIIQEPDAVRLVDALSVDAVAPDGRINFNALTHWTDGTALPEPREDMNEVAGRDGRSVDRGGAGQRIPGFLGAGPGLANAAGARLLFTEPDSWANGTPTAFRPLNADASTATVLQSALGSPDATHAEGMLRWVRGRDEDDLNSSGNKAEARAWILGDPLHSRPFPINYGARGDYTLADPDIRIVMGSNDGYMRMFRNTDPGGGNSGVESWGFMPRAVMNQMQRLRTNVPGGPGESLHPYTVDGAPTVYVRDVNGNGTIDTGDRVILIFGLRRGGRAYYAIDATNPDDPKMLWRITSADTGFEELGLSYATPQIADIRLAGERVPVVIFAGGYDVNKDIRPGPGTNDTMGRAVFVVNAVTGALIWRAAHGASTGSASATAYQHVDMVDSIASDLTVVDTTGDGYADRAYVGDTGGTVWRIDMPRDLDTGSSDTTTWKASVLAYTGRHFSTEATDDRRYFHAPDVVLARDGESAFDAIVIGSGNRENPLDRGGPAVENVVYMIKDRHTVSGVPQTVPYDHLSFGPVTDNCLQLNECPAGEEPDLTNGWRLHLEEVLGEKALAIPFTISGTVFFTTYLPPGSSETATCGPSEGAGMLYAVSLYDATSTINFDTTDDNPDHPGEATSRSDRSRQLRSGGIPAEVVSLPPNRILLPDLSTEAVPGTMRWRTFWYENEDPNGF
ncbi:MAG: pilus assembly protein [Gammaproteobacteria bacterium]